MTDNMSLALIPTRTEQQALDSVKVMANIVQSLRKDVLKQGMDYGVIPGTGEKPTLLLPGMEKLMRALNAVPEYIEKCVIRDYDKPLFHYEYECRLIDADTGLAIPGGRGIGLCTSYESAFRWRDQKRSCPTCGKQTIFKSKDKPEWYCWKKKEGCGATFPENDIRITSQQVGRIENPDIYDQVNAIMKRAKKRALGDAVKGAANVSEFFTVDLEDLARYDDVIEGNYVEVEDDKPATPKASTPPADKPATPKSQNVTTGWQLGDLYNAVRKDVYNDKPDHMRNSIAKLIDADKLPQSLTLQQAIEVVKAHRAEKDTDKPLPYRLPDVQAYAATLFSGRQAALDAVGQLEADGKLPPALTLDQAKAVVKTYHDEQQALQSDVDFEAIGKRTDMFGVIEGAKSPALANQFEK